MVTRREDLELTAAADLVSTTTFHTITDSLDSFAFGLHTQRYFIFRYRRAFYSPAAAYDGMAISSHLEQKLTLIEAQAKED